MNNNKINTLAEFLGVDVSEIEQGYDTNIFTYGNQEYAVLTDTEADETVKNNIKQELWAFNADFIIRHCKNYDDMDNWEYDSAIESLRHTQEHCCESANGLVYALIDDIDEFIDDAVIEDGRGHFISYYDGIENEFNDLYIYKLN